MTTTTYRQIHSQEKAIPGTWRYKRIKWGIFSVGVSVFAQLYNYQPLLSEITDYFHVTPTQSSYLVSASTLGMAIGLLLFAFIADRFTRKEIMVFSLVTSTILTIGSIWVEHFPVLININLIKGMCISGVSAVTLAYLAEEIDSKNIGLAISFYLAGNTFGGMFGRLVAAFISGWLGWQMAVLSIGIISAIIAVVFYIYFPNSKFFEPQKLNFTDKLDQMKSIFQNKKILAMYVVAICLMGSFVSVYNFLGFKLAAAPFNLPHYLIALIFLMYAFGIFSNMVAGSLSDRFSAKRILFIALTLLLIGIIAMSTTSLVIVITGLVIFTMAFFSGHTIASKVVTTMAGKAKSSATALYWLFYYLGSSILGSSTGVFVNKANWSGYFITLTLLSILAIAATYISTRKTN
ncbi:MFS transporter [Myroides pelagicus]|uniref:MFS transporter n=1 Tax=Myroides pelagicus TaxID=270914 RepID=A0A7K1GLR9_9FLAO|nr:MFS transporter [Myroides pelagicus]MEC4114102.1 MFS transporter [Myroides pelagicus]MTH29174.1 MFS transporter [Myroides pelagicus]